MGGQVRNVLDPLPKWGELDSQPRQAREQIRAALDADGLREGADYWVVA